MLFRIERKYFVRSTDSVAGRGDWKKRMAFCNEKHTGFNVTWPEKVADFQ